MSDYMNTLAKASGFLGLKMCLTHMLTVRTRLLTGKFKADEDTKLHPVIVSLFKVMLGAYGPAINVDRLLGVVSNSVENEPFWFAVFLMLGLTKETTETHIKLIWAFVVCRYIQAISYIVGVQPYRALSFVSGLGITLFGSVELIR